MKGVDVMETDVIKNLLLEYNELENELLRSSINEEALPKSRSRVVGIIRKTNLLDNRTNITLGVDKDTYSHSYIITDIWGKMGIDPDLKCIYTMGKSYDRDNKLIKVSLSDIFNEYDNIVSYEDKIRIDAVFLPFGTNALLEQRLERWYNEGFDIATLRGNNKDYSAKFIQKAFKFINYPINDLPIEEVTTSTLLDESFTNNKFVLERKLRGITPKIMSITMCIQLNKKLVNYNNKINESENLLNNYKEYKKEMELLNEYNISKDESLIPIFIILSKTDTPLGKAIRTISKTPYSHVSISLDRDLSFMYSMGRADKNSPILGGFAVETLKGTFMEFRKESKIKVNTLFVEKYKAEKLKHIIDFYILRGKKLRYSIKGLVAYLFSMDYIRDDYYFCSQFVNDILLEAGIKLIDKPSTQIHPMDFDVDNVKNSLYFNLYEGISDNYNDNIIRNNLNRIINRDIKIKNNIVNESYVFLNEAKEFPAQFDEDGNLILKNLKSLDIEKEYQRSIRLLKLYNRNNNIEGIKYEISKLWLFNIQIEDKLHKAKLPAMQIRELQKLRARILNSFSHYLKIIMESEKDFNFVEYFNNSPFSDKYYKISNRTLKEFIELLKKILL